MEYQYFLFDSRYKEDPFKAVCFEVCDTFREASDNAPEYGEDTVIVRYEINPNCEMVNPKIMNDGTFKI